LKELIMARKRERSKEEIKAKGTEIESVNNPNTSGLRGQKCRERIQ
jgi:hypothetical protein